MNENDIIKNIKQILSSKYIGDDCAYLKDLDIVVTQDSLIENIHFDMNYITPFQLGYKSMMVNISDVAASGAKPMYVTVSLSFPKIYNNEFVTEFYNGCKKALLFYNTEIVGGDITGSDKIYISVCVIGSTKNRKISSRSNAKIGHKIITSGVHGSSAIGLKILQNNLEYDENLVKSHLEPFAQVNFAKQIATNINEDYAMMDSSDGLVDCLYKIAQNSNCSMCIDFNKIPYDKKIQKYSANYKDFIFYGGEDYQIIATVPENILSKIGNYYVIGEVLPRQEYVVKINDYDNFELINNIDNKTFNHFYG